MDCRQPVNRGKTEAVVAHEVQVELGRELQESRAPAAGPGLTEGFFLRAVRRVVRRDVDRRVVAVAAQLLDQSVLFFRRGKCWPPVVYHAGRMTDDHIPVPVKVVEANLDWQQQTALLTLV